MSFEQRQGLPMRAAHALSRSDNLSAAHAVSRSDNISAAHALSRSDNLSAAHAVSRSDNHLQKSQRSLLAFSIV
jgi:hypothetical protein